jgi:hypothetical protein
MTDSELEARLHDYYATFTPVDSARAIAGVGGAVADARARTGSRLGAWTGRRWLGGAAVAAVAVVLVVAVVTPLWLGSGIGPTMPTSSPSPSPSPSSSPLAETPTPTLGPAKCESFPAETSYEAIGWRGTRVVVLANHFVGCDLTQDLLSVDPAVGQWRTDARLTYPVVDFTISTDGSSIAMPYEDGLLVLDAADKPHQIARPAGAAGDLAMYGLPVLPGGGYLVTGGDKLYRVASDGSQMTADPLPAGYVAVAPTSDPNLFILTPAEDANVEYGLVGTPFRAYLWNLGTGHLKLVASDVSAVERSPDSLAYLEVATNSTWSTLSLASDGSTTPVTRPKAASISPDGSRYVYVPDLSSTTPQIEELRETSTGHVLASFLGDISNVVWKGNVAALVSGSGSSQELVVLDGSTVTRVPLP